MGQTHTNDTPKNKLAAANYCLQGVFTKDLSYKFGRYLGNDTRDAGHRNRGLTRGKEWCVTGPFDYLRFLKFSSLEDLIKQGAGEETESDADGPWSAPWEDSRRIVLVPLIEPDPDEDILNQSIIRGIVNPSPTEHPLLVFTRITLSPTAYELDAHVDCKKEKEPRLGSVLRVIANLVFLLQRAAKENADLPRIAYFGSLSSPDLVTIALPRNATQLHAVHSFARVTRTLRLAELQEGRLWEDPAQEREESVAKQCPGHACVMTIPTLAFQLGARTEVFAKKSFREDEKRHRVRFDFRLRVDSGHEAKAIRDIEGQFKRDDGEIDVEFERFGVAPPPEQHWGKRGTDETSFPTKDEELCEPVVAYWDTHLIRGRFYHLEALAKTWENLWFKDVGGPNSWRSLNLLDSITDVSMGDDVAGWVQDKTNWVIAASVRNDLKEIQRQLKKFASRFLNPTQNAELASIFNAFHTCFFRQDLLGTARDLFPFFRQLGHALGDIPRWESYLGLNRSVDRDDSDTTAYTKLEEMTEATDRWSYFQGELQDLITQLNRAVRNRIDERSTIGNPPFPPTLRLGACKIISAYTYVVHLCYEVLSRSIEKPKDMDQPFATATCFAACVHAGTVGRVEIAELFDGLRKFVEYSEGPTSAPKLLSQGEAGKWTSRLFMQEIPPQSLLRPEYAIAHSLHEIAELSDWIMLSKCDALRAALNDWVLDEAIQLLWKRMDRLASLSSVPDSQVQARPGETGEQNFEVFAQNFVPYCLAARSGKVDAAATRSAVVQHAMDVRLSSHPVKLAEELRRSLLAVGSDQSELSRYGATMASGAPGKVHPWGSTEYCLQAADDPLFVWQLEALRDLATEFVGDIGMYCGLYAVLNPTNTKMQPARRLDLVFKCFRSVLEVAKESGPKNAPPGRLTRMILHRLTLQAAAVMDPEFDDARLQQEILTRLNVLDTGLTPKQTSAFLQHSLDRRSQFDQTKGLVASLRSFVPYGGADDRLTLSFPAGDGADQVVRAIRTAWDEGGSVQSRLNLLLVLWAGSTRFAVTRLFTTDKGTGGAKPSWPVG